MKKKIIYVFIIINFLITLNNNIYASIEEITSPAYVLMEKESGRIILEKNMNQKRSIASLTKVLTSIVVLETAKLNETVIISAKSAGVGGSTVGVIKDAKVSVENLMYSLLLCSGNDAAIALAEHVGGSVEGFSKLMNEKAKEIGAYSSHFVTPHGLDNEQHYSTAADMAKITAYALRIKTFRNIISTRSITVNLGTHTREIRNTNRLLRTYTYTTGVKTGFTNNANKCFIGSAKKGNLEFISVVLGNDNTDNRFKDSQDLLEYGIDNYKNVDLDKILNWYVKINILKGKKDVYKSYEKGNLIYPLKEGELENIVITQEVLSELKAPCNKGMKIGEIYATLNNKLIYKKEIFLNESIKRKEIKDYFIEGVKNIFNIDIEF